MGVKIPGYMLPTAARTYEFRLKTGVTEIMRRSHQGRGGPGTRKRHRLLGHGDVHVVAPQHLIYLGG